MTGANQAAKRFFGVVVRPQSYLNLLYLLVAFPLGLLYFVLLVTGLATGLSLVIVWVGIPILVLLGIVCWALSQGERMMAKHWLQEDMPTNSPQLAAGAGIWERVKKHLGNRVTWTSLLYLLMKGPLGLAAFTVLATLLPLTVALIAMPFLYEFVPDFQTGASVGLGTWWQIDSLGDAVLACLGGLALWPVALHVTNGMAWVHAKFARVML